MGCSTRIKKKPVLNYLNDPLSLLEFNKAIMKIILHKDPGLNGVSPNAIKALNDENRLILFQICSDFLDNDVEKKTHIYWKSNPYALRMCTS